MQNRRGRPTGPRTNSDDDGPAGGGGSGVDPHELAGLGLTMGAAIALFALGGNWLDGRLGTRPLFVLLGVALGFAGGFLSMYTRLTSRTDGWKRRTPDDE